MQSDVTLGEPSKLHGILDEERGWPSRISDNLLQQSEAPLGRARPAGRAAGMAELASREDVWSQASFAHITRRGEAPLLCSAATIVKVLERKHTGGPPEGGPPLGGLCPKISELRCFLDVSRNRLRRGEVQIALDAETEPQLDRCEFR